MIVDVLLLHQQSVSRQDSVDMLCNACLQACRLAIVCVLFGVQRVAPGARSILLSALQMNLRMIDHDTVAVQPERLQNRSFHLL